ncbi:hypothetical protein M514_06842, partial [Trichuris suis]
MADKPPEGTPGDADELRTEPDKRISFNSPFATRQKSCLRLHNVCDKPIMWIVKTTMANRFYVQPTCGALEPKASTNVNIAMLPFTYKPGMNDRVTVQSCVIPDGVEKKFDMDYLQKCEIVKRKAIPIHYHF